VSSQASDGWCRRSDSQAFWAADTVGPSGSRPVRLAETVGQAVDVRGRRRCRCEKGGEERRCEIAVGWRRGQNGGAQRKFEP
jgi:hypothetical protein